MNIKEKLQGWPITKDLLVQHKMMEEEYKKIVEIPGREPNLMVYGM